MAQGAVNANNATKRAFDLLNGNPSSDPLSVDVSKGIQYYSYPDDMDFGQKGNSIMFTIFSPLKGYRGKNDRYGRIVGDEDSRIIANTGSNSLVKDANQIQTAVQRKTRGTGFEGIAETISPQPYRQLDRAIVLYMPAGVQFSSQINWSESDMGFIGDIVGTDFNNESGLQGFLLGLSEMSGKGGQRALRKVGEGIQQLTDLKVIDAVQLSTGTILNPYREILFKGLQNRTFQFTFKFMPRSQKESQTVKNIIDIFRFHSHPSLGGESEGATDGSLFVYPSEFEIKFYHHEDENTYIPKISTCALTNVSVSYGDVGQYVTHPDGGQVETSLTLQFTELELMTKERIEAGF